MTDPTAIPASWPERLKHALIPSRLYIRNKLWRERRHGEPELRLLPFLVDRSRGAVDAGANKGVYTEALARLVPRVYAFEPNPKMFALLKRGRAANVEAFEIALSNAGPSAVLRVPRQRTGRYSNQGATLAATKLDKPHLELSVQAARLDGLGLGPVGFIKIDVEGFEQEVLEGAAGLIARDRPVLLIEIEERYTKRAIEADLARVLALGYAGLFLERTRLTPLARFDPERHHRRPEPGLYVNNFIFLPLG